MHRFRWWELVLIAAGVALLCYQLVPALLYVATGHRLSARDFGL